jgi:hypothetical protein
LVRCRPGWADTYPDGNADRDAYGHADRDTHGHAYGHADLAARPPNADFNSNGYADRHADRHPDCSNDGNTYGHPNRDTDCDAVCDNHGRIDRIGRRLGLRQLRPGDAPRRRQRRLRDRERHRGGHLPQLRDPGGHG